MYNFSAKQIFWGNILLIICCVFYLAWWLLAFKPVGAVKGMKTGWLLLPASIAGLVAVFLTVKGISSGSVATALIPIRLLLFGGIAAYLILWVITNLLFKRPVTSELFLITGWVVLALSEISVLYGMGRFSHGQAIIFVIIIGASLLISLVCYVLYYNLGARAGYIDGMIPLLLVALIMAGISAVMAV